MWSLMTHMEQIKKYLTCSEAAEILRVDRHTISRYTREGRLPGVRVPGGRKILIPLEAVDGALHSAKRKPVE